MAQKVGRYQIELDLETGKLVSQFAGAQRTVATNAKKMQKALAGITSGIDFRVVGTALGAAGLAAVAFAAFVKDGAKEAMAAEKAQLQLAAALGSGTGRITAMTAALQRRTGADADAMNQQAAALASMGLTTDQIERAIPAIRAYAEVTGKNAAGAVKSLGKAFEQGKVDEKIASLSAFIPAADAATETFGGTVERLSRNFGELQEEIGSSVIESEALIGVLAETDATILDLTGNAEGLGSLLGDVLAEEAQDAAEAVAVLAGALADMIDPSEGVRAQLTNLVPGVLAFRVVTGLFASDEAVSFSDALRTMSERTAEYSKRLGEAREKTEALMSEEPAGMSSDLSPSDLRARELAAARAERKAEADRKRKTKTSRSGAPEKLGILGEGPEINTGQWRANEEAAAMAAMDEQLAELKKELEAAAEAQREAVEASRTIAGFAADTALDAVFQPLEDGFLDIQKIMDGLKNAVLSLVKEMIKAIAMKAILGVATGGTTTVGGAILSKLGFADGGFVGGNGGARADNIPAWLSSGEYVNDAATVDHYGAGFFAALQQRKIPAFASGGLVGGGSAGGRMTGAPVVTVNIDGRGMDEDTLSRAVGRALRQAGIRGDSDLRSVLPTSPTSLLRRG